MKNERVEVPRALMQMREELAQAKALIQRLEKGQNVIMNTVKKQEVIKSLEAAALFNKLAAELNDYLEHALFMHELLTTGRTTVVTRTGRVVNSIDYHPQETVVVDLFVLESLKKLEEVFGPNFRDSVELVN